MPDFPSDVYTEPEPSADTLANLGPLRALAGVWTSDAGHDVNPKADGPEHQAFVEHIDLQPIDAQTNGPQLLYGLRYHTRIAKPGEVEAFHDQVGYWLWEPATDSLVQSLSIPRGQTALAMGHAAADATTFSLEAVRESETNGILSNPFLEYAFKTTRYRITVTVHADGSWSYEQETQLTIPGQREPFLHTDRNTLRKIADATPNPTALARTASFPSTTQKE